MWVTHYKLLGFFGAAVARKEQGGSLFNRRQKITKALLAQRHAQEQQARDAERLAQEQAAALAAEQAAQALERFHTDALNSRVDVPAPLDVQRIAAEAIRAAKGVRAPDATAGRQALADAEALALAKTAENNRRAQILLTLLEAWR